MKDNWCLVGIKEEVKMEEKWGVAIQGYQDPYTPASYSVNVLV